MNLLQFFPFRIDPFQNGDKKIFLKELPSLKVYLYPLKGCAGRESPDQTVCMLSDQDICCPPTVFKFQLQNAEASRWPNGQCFWLQITRSWVLIPLQVEFISWLYGTLLHRPFHYHLSIVSIWQVMLRGMWKTELSSLFCRMHSW